MSESMITERPQTGLISNLGHKLSRPKTGRSSIFMQSRRLSIMNKASRPESGKEWVSPFVAQRNPLMQAKLNQRLKSAAVNKKPQIYVPIEEATEYLEAMELNKGLRQHHQPKSSVHYIQPNQINDIKTPESLLNSVELKEEERRLNLNNDQAPQPLINDSSRIHHSNKQIGANFTSQSNPRSFQNGVVAQQQDQQVILMPMTSVPQVHSDFEVNTLTPPFPEYKGPLPQFDKCQALNLHTFVSKP